MGFAGSLPLLEVREATPADAPAIAAVHVRSWWATYRDLLSDEYMAERTVERRTEQWREWLASGTRVVAAWRAGRLIGFCARGDDEIHALYVDPDHLRTGAGTALMQRALAEIPSAEVTLWVFEANAAARAFYARFGFAPDGAADEPPDGPREIRLRASLASSGAS